MADAVAAWKEDHLRWADGFLQLLRSLRVDRSRVEQVSLRINEPILPGAVTVPLSFARINDDGKIAHRRLD